MKKITIVIDMQNDFLTGALANPDAVNIIPSVLLNLGAGSVEEGHICSMHNAGMIANEDVLPTGVAIYCQCATQWLEENA